MINVLLDNQVYENQSFGGISRYFNELAAEGNMIQKMELFQSPVTQRKNLYQRVVGKINRSLNRKNRKQPDKYDYYKSQLNQLDYDVFHPTYYDPYFLEEIKRPFVVTVHDMIHEKYAEYFGSSKDSAHKRQVCAAASKVIAVSKNTKKDLIDIFNIPEAKIEVIYHATNFDSTPFEKPDINFKEGFILFTGNRDLYKNFLAFLISIAPILRTSKVQLICTGKAFNHVENRWIKDLGVQNKVKQYYCESDQELRYLYMNAECFVFPSLYEGFGFPLLEAFASGCPIVSSPGGSLKEIAGNAAFYFDPKDITSMRDAVWEVLSNEKLRRELKRAGKERLQDFSWDKCRRETMELYSSLK